MGPPPTTGLRRNQVRSLFMGLPVEGAHFPLFVEGREEHLEVGRAGEGQEVAGPEASRVRRSITEASTILYVAGGCGGLH